MPQRSVEVQLLYAIIKHRYEIPGLAKGRTQSKNLQIHFFFTKLFVIGIHRIPGLHNQVTKNVSNAAIIALHAADTSVLQIICDLNRFRFKSRFKSVKREFDF